MSTGPDPVQAAGDPAVPVPVADDPAATPATTRATTSNERLTHWPVPGYYGSAEAVQMMGTVAAPLLAGFAITLATLVVTSASAVRWPGATMVVAALAAVMLLGSVQLTFWARQAVVTPSDMREWWDDADTVAGRGARVREMRGFATVQHWYAGGARNLYDLGVVLLLAALALVLAPPSDARQAALRWLAVGVAGLAVLLEIGWTAVKRGAEGSADRRGRIARWLVRRPTDHMESE
jgi:hypothetical protein